MRYGATRRRRSSKSHHNLEEEPRRARESIAKEGAREFMRSNKLFGAGRHVLQPSRHRSRMVFLSELNLKKTYVDCYMHSCPAPNTTGTQG